MANKYTEDFPLLDADSIELVKEIKDEKPLFTFHQIVSFPGGEVENYEENYKEEYLGPIKVWAEKENPRKFKIAIKTLLGNSFVFNKIVHNLMAMAASPQVDFTEKTIISAALARGCTWDSLINAATGSAFVNDMLLKSVSECIVYSTGLYYYYEGTEPEYVKHLVDKIYAMSDEEFIENKVRLFNIFDELIRNIDEEGNITKTDKLDQHIEDLLGK